MTEQEKREKVIGGLEKCAALHQGFVCECCEYSPNDCNACAVDDALALLKEREPVVHGRWKEIEDFYGYYNYKCSECGMEFELNVGTPAENDMNYCPNCGAKMDGERRESE